MKSVKDYIISIPDFPSKGIIFRDVTSVLESPEGYALAIDELNKLLDGVDYDLIAGTESRGFIFGAPLAYMNKKGFIPVRKKGKLPRETVEMSYDLEYGSATIEIHKDAIKPGDKVVLVDDLIATGGTIQAAAKLVEELGGEVVKLTNKKGEVHEYTVEETRVVNPYDSWVTEESGEEVLTLFTCASHGTRRFMCRCVAAGGDE